MPSGPVDPVLVQWKARLDQLIAQNRGGYEKLARNGIRFPFESVILAQVDCLIDSVAEAMGPAGPQFAVLARTRWEERTARSIAEAEEQGRKQQIAVAGSFTPSMIRDMARATGTFGG